MKTEPKQQQIDNRQVQFHWVNTLAAIGQSPWVLMASIVGAPENDKNSKLGVPCNMALAPNKLNELKQKLTEALLKQSAPAMPAAGNGGENGQAG